MREREREREREIRGVLRCGGLGLVNTIYVLRVLTVGIEKTRKYILADLEKINTSFIPQYALY